MESIRKNKLAITVFMLPAVILFAGIIIIPIIMSFIYSLQDWNGITEPKEKKTTFSRIGVPILL